MISSHVKISFFKSDLVSLTTFKFVSVWSKHLRIFFGRFRQSSVIFEKCPEIFGKYSETFVWPLDQFKLEVRKSWEDHHKRRYALWTFYRKRKIRGRLEIQEFLFSCWKTFHSFAALVCETSFNPRIEISYPRAAIVVLISRDVNA